MMIKDKSIVLTMTEQTKKDIREAAGSLGSVPNRAGMSFLSNCVALELVAACGTVCVFDKGKSSEMVATEIHSPEIEQAQRVMRIGRKRNDGPVVQPKAEPYYRQFDKCR